MPRKRDLGFTLIELLVVIAILAIIAGLATPRLGAAMLELSLIAEARFAHAHAQAVRQHAIMRGRDVRIEYMNSVPARIMVFYPPLETTVPPTEPQAVPEFATRILPTGFVLWPVGHLSKSVTFNSRGEVTWLASGNTIIIRAPNGQERRLIFHQAGRIMLIRP